MNAVIVAGEVRARCSCCSEPTELVYHVALGQSRRMCGRTRKTYADRGDGVYLLDPSTPQALLDDRPVRSDDKTKIQLERATFAGMPQFELDLNAVVRMAPAGLPRERVKQEVADMAKRFPRWVLTLSDGQKLKRCSECEGLLVFNGGVRCVACDRVCKVAPHKHQLAWFGLMPPIGLDGLPDLKAKIVATPPPKHIVGHRPELGHYMLVPLVAAYPVSFPNTSMQVYYLPEFKRVPGMPQAEASHEFHMLPGGQMCLYATGQWSPDISAAAALAERAYAHVIKLLNYCNGKRSAFAIVS
jgi:hypothetical protein